ncbi:trehalose-phosphatase [Gordonia shandongensis]|uniref:trehalose-phosphatase n=1 Tax=Gordonia shandongensis TaxID=376351 RepID=UPI0004023E36|nr:trehalose-phosphatase [Gordonia shandongensis]
MIDDSLTAALAEVAAHERVLVASDYDGCVAPIVSRPEDAVADPRSIAALERAAQAPGTVAALISGRARADLAALSGADKSITLVGSHGAEFESGFDDAVTDRHRDLLARIVADLGDISGHFPGATIETKPVSAALHVRNVDDDAAAEAIALAEAGPGAWEGVEVTHGKAVIELAVIKTSKGVALDRLRSAFEVDAVLYLGDDVTDEKAFAHLGPGDVGVKVGAGATAAAFCVEGPDDVAEVLARIADLRIR